MKRTTTLLAAILSTTVLANAQVIISDDYTGSGTDFVLGSGVNSGINPPTTRLGGSAASGLRYIEIGNKPNNLYSITGNKFQTDGNNQFGAATLSSDGLVAFDFSSALGSASATAANPVSYDIAISMANNYGGARPRFSFGLGTTQPADGVGGAGGWDFGVQLFRNVNGGTAYTIGRRIDAASGEGLAADLNEANGIATTANGTYGSEIDFVIRVTDAGAEASSYNSRVQLSMDGGSSFFYDTDTDSALTGFRFDDTGRYFTWDMAGNSTDGGFVSYDDFSVNITPVPEPTTSLLLAVSGIGAAWFCCRRKS